MIHNGDVVDDLVMLCDDVNRTSPREKKKYIFVQQFFRSISCWERQAEREERKKKNGAFGRDFSNNKSLFFLLFSPNGNAWMPTYARANQFSVSPFVVL